MIKTMEIDRYLAVVKYDPDIEMFRGEFTFRHGGADFYAKDIDALRKEGEISPNGKSRTPKAAPTPPTPLPQY